MAINFSKDDGRVVLEYISEQHDASWVNEKLKDRDNHTFYKTVKGNVDAELVLHAAAIEYPIII
jgi:hypothetical protein